MEPSPGGMLKATLLLASTLTVMANALIAPALPELSLAFAQTPHSDLLVRLVLTLPGLSIAICAPIAGLIADRFGRKGVLIFSLVLYGIAGGSGGLVDDLYTLLVMRALLGVAVAGIMTACTTLAGDYFSGQQRTAFMGLQASFMFFGGMVFLGSAGMLAELSWRAPFLVYLVSLPFIPLVLFYLYEPPRKPGAASPGETAGDWVPGRSVVFLYALVFGSMVIWYLIPTQLPFLLKDNLGANNTSIGLIIAAMSLAAGLMAMQYRRIRARLSLTAILGLCFLIVGLSYLPLSLTTEYWRAILGMVASGLGFGLFMPTVALWAVSLVPAHLRGRVVGGLTSAIYLGQFASPLLAQPLTSLRSIEWIFALAAIMMLVLSAGFWLATAWRRSRRPPLFEDKTSASS
ncbi:MAG: MFS transporter [Deltaproteobacteria bacterium]|nr:MFS transporter [Deltaproteobacteria bacterium]